MVSHTRELGKIFLMSDDFVGLIISKISIKDDRKSFSEVCKQWFEVEGLSRSSLRVFADRPGFSLAALTRFPNLVHLEIFELKSDIEIEIIAQTCRKIESITIFCFDAHQEGHGGILRGKGLMALGNGCPKLSKVMLAGEDTVRDSGIIALLHSKHSLDALVFLSNSLITDQALRAIGLASSISILELVGCSGIKDMGLGFLANGSTSKTLKKLVLNLCRGITDAGVKLLQKMCSLEHLELSYCGRRGEITDIGDSSLSLYVKSPGFSLPALTRFPNIVNLTLWHFKTHTDLEFVAHTCPKLERIRIDCRGKDGGNLSRKGMCALGDGCPKLSEVMIFGKGIGNSGVGELLHSTHNLEALVLINSSISDEALRVIGSTSSISILKLRRCYNVTDEGLAFLANGSTSKTLKKLVLARCPLITDTGVKLLGKMCSLEHLKLSYEGEVSQITDIGGVGISAIRTLRELILNYVNVSDPTMAALAQNCRNLEMLDLGGCERVTGAGIRAFCSHKCLKFLELRGLTNFSLSDVEQIVPGCPSLDSVVVDSHKRFDPTWKMHDKTRGVIKCRVS